MRDSNQRYALMRIWNDQEICIAIRYDREYLQQQLNKFALEGISCWIIEANS